MRNMPRVYTSFMPNAPTLSGVPGKWLDVMKKCLIGGWTPFDISSIVVANGIGTINFNQTKTSLPDYCYLTITGCSEPLLNTEVCIEKGFVTMGQFKTTVADGTYTGSIKAVPPPAGWELMFSGTNTAVIRSSNIDSSRMTARIDDTKSTTASFSFGLDATSINQLVDEATFVVYNVKNMFKAFNAEAAAFRNWAIVCDNTTVWFTTDGTYYQTIEDFSRDLFVGGQWHAFGDYIPNNTFESSPAFYSMSDIITGDTLQSQTTYGRSFLSGDTYATSKNASNGMHSSQFFINSWEKVSFNQDCGLASMTTRLSGSASRLDIMDYNCLFTGLKKPPVNMLNESSMITQHGYLPGLHYSDYNLSPIMTMFKGVPDTRSDNVYLAAPVSLTDRYSNDPSTYSTLGVVFFSMNKKWGN